MPKTKIAVFDVTIPTADSTELSAAEQDEIVDECRRFLEICAQDLSRKMGITIDIEG